MNCPNCGTPAVDGDVFCGACGASLAPNAPAPAQPTQPLPQQPATPQPPAAPQPQPPVYQQPAQPPVQPTAAFPQVAAQPAATAPPPVPGMSTGAVIAITLAGVLVVAGIGVGGYFGWKALSADKDAEVADTSPVTAPVETSEPTDIVTDDTSADPTGFASAEDALAAEMPADWVSDVLSNETDVIEYVVGPPNSEYVDVVVVAQQPDGSWLVENTYAYDTGGTGGDLAIDEAAGLVYDFILAVQEDRADDAHTYTISPFAEDPASASFSNGDLSSFFIANAELQSDGSTVWVWSEEDWTWGTERYIYVCVPTGNGYRISELMLP